MNDLILDDFYGLKEIQPSIAKERLQYLLQGDDELLWASRPEQGLVREDLHWSAMVTGSIMFFYGLYSLVTLVQKTWVDVSNPMPVNTTFMVSIFVGLIFWGYYMAIGAQLSKRWYRSRSYIGVSTKSFLFQNPETTLAIPLKDLQQIELEKKGEHRGHLHLTYLLKLPRSTKEYNMTLEWVPDAPQIHTLIQRTRAANLETL